MPNSIKTLPDRFPPEAHRAFEKIRDQSDFSDVSVVILAAVYDFLPTPPSGVNRYGDFEQLNESQRFIEDLEFDSLAIAELVFFLEDFLAVSVSNTDLLKISTIGELKSFIAQKLQN